MGERVFDGDVQCQHVGDECNVVEVLGVGNAQAAHAVCVLPLLEVLVEGSAPPVALIAAYFALVPEEVVKRVRI